MIAIKSAGINVSLLARMAHNKQENLLSSRSLTITLAKAEGSF